MLFNGRMPIFTFSGTQVRIAEIERLQSLFKMSMVDANWIGCMSQGSYFVSVVSISAGQCCCTSVICRKKIFLRPAIASMHAVISDPKTFRAWLRFCSQMSLRRDLSSLPLVTKRVVVFCG